MRKLPLLALVLIALGGAGWGLYEYVASTRAAASGAAALAPQPAIPVTIGVAAAQDVAVFVRGIGTVQAYNMVLVRSRVDGQIVKVTFTEGQEVKAGDLLCEIDPRPFEAALQQATAAKQKDEAALVSAEADLKRYGELVGHGFQTRQLYDQQKATVAQLQAAIKADQAQIEAAQLNLQYASIRSPIDGRTGARLVDVGNLVHANDNGGLVTIAQLRPIFVSFTVPQSQFAAIRQSARKGPVETQVFTDSEQAILAKGNLSLIDNQIDQATGTLHLKATFANEDEVLWPGEFVNARVVVGVMHDAVTVPARAVQQGPKGAYLFVVKPDMTVEMRSVQVAQVEQGVAAIENGLSAGERIVVDGQYRLEPGSKVRLDTPAAKPDA